MKEKKIPSVIPIYLIGAACLVYSLIFPYYRVTDYLISFCVAGILYIVSKKLIPNKTIMVPETVRFEQTGSKETDEILTKGKENIEKLNRLNARIDNENINRLIGGLAETSTKIFEYIAKNPANARQIRTFTDYYFPTLMKLLETYLELGGIRGESAQDTAHRIENALSEFNAAFEKQLDRLYEDKALDIQTDITVLKNVLAREGLAKGE